MPRDVQRKRRSSKDFSDHFKNDIFYSSASSSAPYSRNNSRSSDRFDSSKFDIEKNSYSMSNKDLDEEEAVALLEKYGASTPGKGKGDGGSSSSSNNNDGDSDEMELKDDCITRYRKSDGAVTAVVAMTLFTDMASYDMLVPLLPSLLHMVGKTEESLGTLFSVYSIGFLIGTPILGYWSDSMHDRKFPLMVGQMGLALATVTFAFSTSFWMLCFARFLQGVAAASTWTLGLALLADNISQEHLGRAMGIAFGFSNFGYFVGPLMSGVLAQMVSLQTPFYFCACASLSAMSLLSFIKPKPPKMEEGEGKTATLFELALVPEIAMIAAIIAVAAASSSAVETLLSVHLQVTYHLDVLHVSLSMLSMVVPSVLFSFLGGWMSDNWDRWKMMFYGLALYSLATPILGLVDPYWGFLCGLSYFGATSSIIQAPTYQEVEHVVDSLGFNSYAQAYAILNVAYSIGMLVGPLVAGELFNSLRFKLTMVLFMIPLISLIPPLLYVQANAQKRLKASEDKNSH